VALPVVLLALAFIARFLGSGQEVGANQDEVIGAGGAQRIELAPYIPSSAVAASGTTFFTREVEFTFQHDRVTISGDPPPSSAFGVDDGIQMRVMHPDGSVVTWRRDFNHECAANVPLPAEDVTGLFQPGLNRVSLTLYDTCGGLKGTTSPIWLTSQ